MIGKERKQGSGLFTVHMISKERKQGSGLFTVPLSIYTEKIRTAHKFRGHKN